MYAAINGTGNAKAVYIMASFRKDNGKTSSRVVKRLGKLSELLPLHQNNLDLLMDWAKEQARIETKKYNDSISPIVNVPLSPNARIDKGSNPLFNVGYLFLQSICTQLRFDNICRNISNRHLFEYDIHAILTDQIFARILHPSSKKSSFEFCHTLLEKPKYKLHDVYRSLSVMAKESDYIQSEIYRNSNFLHKRNTKVLYYDCTNYYFEIEQEDETRKYGKSKEHRPNPIVTMGLFMDADGFPLAFDIFPGNLNEQKTLTPLENKVIRDFECSDFIYCSDSGLGSQKNKLFNDMQGRSYIITQSLKKLKAEDREIALNPKQFRKVGSNKFIDISELDETDPIVFESVYYKEVPIESKKLSETLIVTYSPKYRDYQSKIRQGQIERAEKMIKDGKKSKKNRKNPNDPTRFIREVSTTKHGEVAEEKHYLLDQSVIDKEAMYDGFYAVSTSLDMEVAEIIEINKRRWEIEECFRIMKNEFDARPVFVSLEDHIKSHFLICFLSLLIYRLLEHRLNSKYTVNQIIGTLRSMKMTKLKDDYGYIPSYARTDLTDQLHDTFGFQTDREIISRSSMRSIIKKTKEIKII